LEMKNPINIIGSDGKFSVLTAVKYFLEADNKKVSTFISPHLKDMKERFYFNKKLISIKELKKHLKRIEQTKVKLTLFECLTACYILAASQRKYLDYNLVESGLFFSKDSTRVWHEPRATLVTNINKQHLEWLKTKTITQVCKEKLSKISQNTVIYISKQNPQTLKIIKNILKKNKSKKIYSSNWKIFKKKDLYFYKDKKNLIAMKTNKIYSEGLIQNLGMAIKVALDFGVPKAKIEKTVPKIEFVARISYLSKGKLCKLVPKNNSILLDGAHSETSAKNLYHYLKTLKKPIYCILAMGKNKLPEPFIKSFKKIFKKIITIKTPNEPNALEAHELKKICKKYVPTETATSIEGALRKLSSKDSKIILCCGSFYFSGYVLNRN
jgi:dihydrofolate synthase / folylpolyglutamate synthase